MLYFITKCTQLIEHIASKVQLIFHIVARYYHDVINNEISLANIKSSDHILCIGGGFCPFSAILLHMKTMARITVIDNDSKCTKNAIKLIKRLGLEQGIHIVHCDARNEVLTYDDFTVVHFALQTTPIHEVFESVKSRVSVGTKLLIRRPKARIGYMYSCLLSSRLTDCEYIHHNKACNIGTTYLYKKSVTNAPAS